MEIHAGHRERLKERFAQHGLDNFDDHNVLELLLFYALPRVDTNELAHRLIAHFGGLDAVLEAPVSELEKIGGIGRNTAIYLRLLPQVSRRYNMTKASRNKILNTTELAGAYLVPRFHYERDEVVYMICLDAKLQILCCREMSRGAVTSAEISIRKIVELALSQNASNVIISHNHTSGIAIPSAEDESTTLQIKRALAPMDIRLLDHIIVAGDDFVSMSDSGLM
jgi:DNA repair protein RadC